MLPLRFERVHRRLADLVERMADYSDTLARIRDNPIVAAHPDILSMLDAHFEAWKDADFGSWRASGKGGIATREQCCAVWDRATDMYTDVNESMEFFRTAQLIAESIELVRTKQDVLF